MVNYERSIKKSKVMILLWMQTYMYKFIFDYYNYNLPDFVTATCLGFIFGFSVLDICFNLNAITNHLCNILYIPLNNSGSFVT